MQLFGRSSLKLSTPNCRGAAERRFKKLPISSCLFLSSGGPGYLLYLL